MLVHSSLNGGSLIHTHELYTGAKYHASLHVSVFLILRIGSH